MISFWRIACLLAALSTPATSQRCIYNEDSLPARGDAGPADVFREGLNWMKWHFLVTPNKFRGLPSRISDIALASWIDGTRRFGSLTIRMGHTSRTELDTNFAANLSEPLTTVLDVTDHHWTYGAREWSSVGLASPFLYLPSRGHLLIEVVQHDVDDNVSTVQRLDFAAAFNLPLSVSGEGLSAPPASGRLSSRGLKLRLCVDAPELLIRGRGCDGSNGTPPGLGLEGDPRPGGTVDAWLSNAAGQSSAFLALGVDIAPPLPLDLTSAGMPGCSAYFDILDTIPAHTDAVGLARVHVSIPDQPVLIAATFYTQYFVVDSANTAGLVSTNYGRVLIGR